MLSSTRRVVAVALAATALTTAPAFASLDGTATDARGENARSLGTPPASPAGRSFNVTDARGENATSLGTPPASPAGRSFNVTDARGENAASTPTSQPADVPTAQPVVVEVSRPIDTGFDWTAAIIGMGAGLAFAVLAGVGITGARRHPVRPSIG